MQHFHSHYNTLILVIISYLFIYLLFSPQDMIVSISIYWCQWSFGSCTWIFTGLTSLQDATLTQHVHLSHQAHWRLWAGHDYLFLLPPHEGVCIYVYLSPSLSLSLSVFLVCWITESALAAVLSRVKQYKLLKVSHSLSLALSIIYSLSLSLGSPEEDSSRPGHGGRGWKVPSAAGKTLNITITILIMIIINIIISITSRGSVRIQRHWR